MRSAGSGFNTSASGRPSASLGHLNQTNLPHSALPQGAISTSIRLFSCSQTPTGVGPCASADAVTSSTGSKTQAARTRITKSGRPMWPHISMPL